MNRWKSGEFESWDKCLRKTGVVRQIIQNRLNDAQSFNQAHDPQQKMPQEMEKILVQ